MGLHRAGFDVTGVDIAPQRRYPFKFIQADAMAPPVALSDFDFIWASPVCKFYTRTAVCRRRSGYEYPDQIADVRAMLSSSGALWCIENVPTAPIRPDLVLDGTMFPELNVIRRRHFELGGFFVWSSGLGPRPREFVTVAGHLFRRDEGRAAMGIDWMTVAELAQAIPPAYSEFIGAAALAHLDFRPHGVDSTARDFGAGRHQAGAGSERLAPRP